MDSLCLSEPIHLIIKSYKNLLWSIPRTESVMVSFLTFFSLKHGFWLLKYTSEVQLTHVSCRDLFCSSPWILIFQVWSPSGTKRYDQHCGQVVDWQTDDWEAIFVSLLYKRHNKLSITQGHEVYNNSSTLSTETIRNQKRDSNWFDKDK